MNTGNFDTVLQTVIYALVVFVVPAVGYFLSNYLHQSSTHVADQRKRALVLDLVKSAEQTLSGDKMKRSYVESTLESLVPGISPTEAHSLIEASVLALHTDMGISSHTPFGLPAEPLDTPAPPPAPPVIDQESLVSALTALVAPALASQVTEIVATHLSPPVTPPPDPAPSSTT